MTAVRAAECTPTRRQRRLLAGDTALRERIIAALKAGKTPLRIASEEHVTCQRVWNIRTELERLAQRARCAERRCLTCGHPFPSWGPGNRRCLSCLKQPDNAFDTSFGSHAHIRLR